MSDTNPETHTGSPAVADRTATTGHDGQTGRRLSTLLVSASPLGVMAVDEHGVIRSASPAAARLLTRHAEDLPGLPLAPPTLVDDTCGIDLIAPGGTSRPVQLRVCTTSCDGQHLYVTTLHDLPRTEHNPQDALRRHSIALVTTVQELDTPLAAITTTLHRLHDHHTTTGRSRADLIHHLEAQVRQLRRVVHNLHAIAATHADTTQGPPEPLRVFEILLERLRDLHEHSRDVSLACEAGLVVFVDRAVFTHMLDNYLYNALTFGAPPIELEAGRTDAWVEIRIRDHGPGIPEDLLPHLFDRHRPGTPDPDSHQSGPDLWVTRSLARLYGGDAWHTPHQPHGACFHLHLPATTPHPPAPAPQPD